MAQQEAQQQGQMEPPTPPGQTDTDNVQVCVFFCSSVGGSVPRSGKWLALLSCCLLLPY